MTHYDDDDAMSRYMVWDEPNRPDAVMSEHGWYYPHEICRKLGYWDDEE